MFYLNKNLKFNIASDIIIALSKKKYSSYKPNHHRIIQYSTYKNKNNTILYILLSTGANI